MTTFISKSELKALMTKTGAGCVSIFMPMHRTGPETQQNPIRLNKLLRMAEKQLIAAGMRVPDAQALLAPGRALLELPDFWRCPAEGLAVFLAPGISRYYPLPIKFKRLLIVADRFHLKPLLPLFSGDGAFYILALSQNEVRLLQGTRDHVEPIKLEHVPGSLAEALKEDEFEKQLQWRGGGAPGAPGKRDVMFHGHGSVTDETKPNLLRYFQQVDKGLQSILSARHAPLILAGVDYLLPIYREANSYPHLMKEGIEGNPERLHAGALHADAWRIVQPFFRQTQRQAMDRFHQLADKGSELAANDLKQILPAAFAARVEILIVAEDVQQWGAFDPLTNEIELRGQARPGDQDLLDLAAIQTYLNGGAVFAVKPDKVPGNGPVAAVFRY